MLGQAGGGGGPSDVRCPKQIRRAFSCLFSGAFCPNRDRLGRTLLRIGRRWAALGFTLLPVALGPYLLGTCHGHLENVTNDMTHLGAPVQRSIPGAELKYGFPFLHILSNTC